MKWFGCVIYSKNEDKAFLPNRNIEVSSNIILNAVDVLPDSEHGYHRIVCAVRNLEFEQFVIASRPVGEHRV